MSINDDGQRAAILVKLKSNVYKIIILDTQSYEIQSMIKPVSKNCWDLEFIDNENLLLHSRYPVEVWNIKENRKVWSFTKIES